MLLQKFKCLWTIKRAIIEDPDEAKEEIELFDNGIPADITKNDGIYSRYFSSSTLVGRYTVYCKVWNSGTATVQRFGKYFLWWK